MSTTTDWTQVGKLIEVINDQRVRQHIAGTTNWAAAVCQLMAEATRPAQQQPRVGPGKTAEQTLAQWEHDLVNPPTPEQAEDFVRRERAFAAQQPAQQPTPRYEPTDEGIGND